MSDDNTSVDLEGANLNRLKLEDNSSIQPTWVLKSPSENITEAMERAPLGAMLDIVYASLTRRVKDLLTPEHPMHEVLCHGLVATAVNFKVINPGYAQAPKRNPVATGDQGAGHGSYHSTLWGPNKDERLPHTLPQPTAEQPFSAGMQPQIEANKGLQVAKLFHDLQHHIPCVLFNVVNVENTPLGVGGSAVTRKIRVDGKTVTEVGYRSSLTVEASVVTEDDNSTSNLQAIISACFGMLRDQMKGGALITGKSWQLSLSGRIMPSAITDVEAPWSQGDSKMKLYTCTVGLEDIAFECFTWIGKPVDLQLTGDPSDAGEVLAISVAGETSSDGPIEVKLGQTSRLILSGMSLTDEVVVSQAKKIVELRKPHQGSGYYEIVGRRVGEASLVVYDSGSVSNVMSPTTPLGWTSGPLVQRKVVVSPV